MCSPDNPLCSPNNPQKTTKVLAYYVHHCVGAEVHACMASIDRSIPHDGQHLLVLHLDPVRCRWGGRLEIDQPHVGYAVGRVFAQPVPWVRVAMDEAGLVDGRVEVVDEVSAKGGRVSASQCESRCNSPVMHREGLDLGRGGREWLADVFEDHDVEVVALV